MARQLTATSDLAALFFKDKRCAVALLVVLYAALYAQMTAGAPGPFAIDESIYIAMADAMARRGDLAIQDNGGVEASPALMLALSGYGADGRVYPQYPAGYALIAAPLYALWGVNGLFFLNAAAGLAAIFLVRDIARRLFRDDRIADWSALLFALATYFPSYAAAIWPHTLTLAILLGAADAAIIGAGEEQLRRPQIALSGALIAFAATIRVDSVLFFAPIFIWLRLFAAPEKRSAAFIFFAGAAPCLALASCFNFLKYGLVAPVSYGAPSEYETIRAYLPLAAAGVIGAAMLFAVDIRRFAAPVRSAAAINKIRLAAGLAAIIAVAALYRPLGALAHHLWTLLFDLQAYNGDYFHDILHRDAAGFLTTFGLPKKAFFQSMPFFMLAIIPAVEFSRGSRARPISFCLLFAAAPIAFYALKQWHGGYALNMRFFFPAVPFLAILSAVAVAPLAAKIAGGPARFALTACAALAALFTLQFWLIAVAPAYNVAALTYPQLIIALALAACSISYLLKRASEQVLLFVAAVAVGASAASGLGDFFMTKEMRGKFGAADAYFSRAIPKGSLVVSYEEVRMSGAFRSGISMLHPDSQEAAKIAAAIRAFDEAGRCVYVRKGEVASLVAKSSGRALAPAASAAPKALDLFDTLAPIRPGCALP